MINNNSFVKIFSFVLCLALTLGSFTLLISAKEEKYTPIEWEMDDKVEYLMGGDKRYDRYYVRGAFYGDASSAFYFSDPVEYDGASCQVYGDSAYPHIVSVKANNGYSYVFVDGQGREILDSFVDRSDCIYFLEVFDVEYTKITRDIVEDLDKEYNRNTKLKRVDVAELGEADILEITVHDRTESKASQHGAVYIMPDGSYYYVCFEKLDNSYFDADGYFSYRSGSVGVYELDARTRADIESAREDMIPRERKIIYESRVISGYCDIDGNPVDDKDLDDPEERAVAIVMFYVVTILVGIVLPALLLAFGLGMARSKKTGYAKCWYALLVTSVIWILAAILFVLIVIL